MPICRLALQFDALPQRNETAGRIHRSPPGVYLLLYMNYSRNSFPRCVQNRCPGPSSDRPGRIRRMPFVAVPTEYHAAEASGPSISSAVLRKGSVLLVAGEIEVGGMLRFCLEKEGYEVLDASTLPEALHLCSQSCPTAIVLNLDMAGLDSFEVLRQLRRQSRSHIMALSSADDQVSKIRAFDSGANDYLVRPVSMAELAARLRAIQRPAPVVAAQELRAGELTVDLANRSVKIGGRLVKLTATEFSLLSLFVRHAGEVLTHAQILREVWGPKMVKKLQYLRVYLKSLRDKLEKNPAAPELFITERAFGYRLAVPEG